MSSKQKQSQNYDPIFNKLNQRMKSNPYLIQREKQLSSFMEGNYYKFRTLPLYLWIPGFTFLLFAIAFTVIHFIVLSHEKRLLFIIFLNVLCYYLGFIIIYSGKIEIIEINRKVLLIQ